MSAKQNQSVIIANDLRTGRSVYFTHDARWTDSFDKAQVLTDGQSEERLQAALLSEQNNLVIDPYLIEVSQAKSALQIRERIRVEGPSILKQHPLLTQDIGQGSRAA